MNNKGVSLIALVVMRIVMIIIAGIAINNSVGSYDQALEAKALEERRQVSNAISARFGSNQINSIVRPIIGEVIPNEYLNKSSDEEAIIATRDYLVKMFFMEGRLVTDDEMNNKTTQKKIEKFLRDNIQDMEYTRVLRQPDLVELGLESISIESVFLVNYYSTDVVGPIQ